MRKKRTNRLDPKLWRHSTQEELHQLQAAAINTLKKLGRPKKDPTTKYKAISIKLDPKLLKWAKKEAKKRNIGYQTFINLELLKKAA